MTTVIPVYKGKKKTKIKLSKPSRYDRLAKQIKNIKRNVDFNEDKFHAVNGSGTVSNNGGISLLTGMAQGDTDQTRDGNSIKSKRLEFRLTCDKDATATNTYVRAIIFKDKRSNGVVPTVAELVTNANCYTPLNPDNRTRFKVYFDRTVSLDGGRGITSVMKWQKRIYHPLEYTGATGAQSSCDRNHFYLFLITNEDTNKPTANWTTMFHFIG